MGFEGRPVRGVCRDRTIKFGATLFDVRSANPPQGTWRASPCRAARRCGRLPATSARRSGRDHRRGTRNAAATIAGSTLPDIPIRPPAAVRSRPRRRTLQQPAPSPRHWPQHCGRGCDLDHNESELTLQIAELQPLGAGASSYGRPRARTRWAPRDDPARPASTAARVGSQSNAKPFAHLLMQVALEVGARA